MAKEQARISQSGGEVRVLTGQTCARVFKAGHCYPGLAMSRAMGDFVAQSCGVVPTPQVGELDLRSGEEQLLLLCSDGVWEFISTQEAIDLVQSFPRNKITEAAEALQDLARGRWEEHEAVVDDITVVIVDLAKQTAEDAASTREPSEKSLELA